MRLVLALILIALTTFGGLVPAAAGCCPQMPPAAHHAAPAEGHHGQDDAGDGLCASHLCCAVALTRTVPASRRIESTLSPRLLAEHLPSIPTEPLFRPPIARLSL